MQKMTEVCIKFQCIDGRVFATFFHGGKRLDKFEFDWAKRLPPLHFRYLVKEANKNGVFFGAEQDLILDLSRHILMRHDWWNSLFDLIDGGCWFEINGKIGSWEVVNCGMVINEKD